MTKKFSAFIILCLIILTTPCFGRENDYYISRDDAWEANSYNRRDNSLLSDYDNDGTPNYIDPYDNDWFKDPGFRDYDNDGIPNYYDPYDNDWYK
ncbi:MAG: hypothetical protein U9Q24_04855 [Candidatus Ratteibacteria bacterium]|nr:hypothetical protein [Candidatus Ratteibacteria bacterium]